MRRSASLLLLLGAFVACGMAACGDDDDPKPTTPGQDGGSDSPVNPGNDSGPTPDGQVTTDAQTDAPPGDPLFTDYVKDLITNQTADNTLPDDWTTKTFAPDPEDPNAFASFFP